MNCGSTARPFRRALRRRADATGAPRAGHRAYGWWHTDQSVGRAWRLVQWVDDWGLGRQVAAGRCGELRSEWEGTRVVGAEPGRLGDSAGKFPCPT
jgi:hypothetical protein